MVRHAGPGDQIDSLQTENDSLRSELETLKNDRARADALDALLRVSSVGGYRFVPAEVIAVGPAQDFAWTVTIDAGRNDGIEADMSVINGQGLVGRVLKTTASTSTVVLIVDATSAVGGRVAGTEEIGIVSGTGRQDTLEFQLLDPRADVRVGDCPRHLRLQGRSAVRARGCRSARSSRSAATPGQLTRVATVAPFVDVSQLSVVGVVTKPPREDPTRLRPAAQSAAQSLAGSGTARRRRRGGRRRCATSSAAPSAAPTTETAATPQPAKKKQKGVRGDPGAEPVGR